MTPLFSAIQKLGNFTAHWAKSVLYVDRGVIILNKPPGLICQLQGQSSSTGIYRDGNDFTELLNDLQENLSLTCLPYPVHRLDKGTTGCLVLARSISMARELSRQFQAKTVEKTYLALVCGGEKSFASRSGKIRAPLQSIDGHVSLDSSWGARPSATDWELVASSPVAPLSLVRLKLLTGHKHQLRVHMAHSLQVPILGDTLYSRSRIPQTIANKLEVPENRILLHASEISFLRYKASGPSKRLRLGIRAPLPKDFIQICIDSEIPLNSEEAGGNLCVNGVPTKDGKLPDLDGHLIR